MSRKSKYTKEFLEPIVKESKSITEILTKLGKKGGYNLLKSKIKYFNIDTSHFIIVKKYTRDVLDKIQRDYNLGMNWNTISKLHDIPISTIIKYVKIGKLYSRNHSDASKLIKRNNLLYADEYFLNIQKEYNDGMTWKEISIKHNISLTTIMKYVKLNRLKSRTLSESLKLRYKNPGNLEKLRNLWTPERRKKQSNNKKQFYYDHPEKHPLSDLAKHPEKLTYPERITYRFLEQLGIEFKPQEHIDRFWVDYLIEDKLVLEIDSRFHDNRKEHDAEKDAILIGLGYTIVRIPAKNVYDNLQNLFKDYNKDIKLDLKKIKGEEIIVAKYRKPDLCTDCGKEVSNNSKRCKTCYTKYNGEKTYIRIAEDRIELDRLIKIKSVESVAKLFGVSSSAIRKRCKILDIEIPKRKGDWERSEIHKNAYNLYKEGKSISEISKILNISEQSIKNRLRTNYDVKSSVNKKIDRNKILKLLDNGMTCKEIIDYFNCSTHMYKIIKKLRRNVSD